MKVFFSDRAFAAVMAETAEKVETETGGLFLGVVEDDSWYVIESIDPGPDSIFEVAYFEYDQTYTEHLINKIANLYETRMSLIGLWHRHPGSFDVFSNVDDGTNMKYAAMRPEGSISALVNLDPKFRLTMYHVEYPHSYQKILYEVGNELIPAEYMALKSPEHFKRMMQGIPGSGSGVSGRRQMFNLGLFVEEIRPWLAVENSEDPGEFPGVPTADTPDGNPDLIDTVLEDICFLTDELGMELSVTQQQGEGIKLTQNIEGAAGLVFSYVEDGSSAGFEYNGVRYQYEAGMFESLYGKYCTAPDENVPSGRKGRSGVIDGKTRFRRKD